MKVYCLSKKFHDLENISRHNFKIDDVFKLWFYRKTIMMITLTVDGIQLDAYLITLFRNIAIS